MTAFPTARLRRTCWLALFAMLALALLPTVSHALASARGGTGSWAEICTPQGMQVAVVDDSGAGGGEPATSASHLEHCPYCTQAGSAPGLPPAVPAPLVLPLVADEPPALFLQAPRTLFAWATAQPRGPPLHS